jgi:hypothetical protein
MSGSALILTYSHPEKPSLTGHLWTVNSKAMIEVFKTNVQGKEQADDLVRELKKHFPASRINIDMHDTDKVLRLEGADFRIEKVQLLVKQNGFNCSLLE